jgi:hypothetical protein
MHHEDHAATHEVVPHRSFRCAEGAAYFSAKVQKMEKGLILERVDDDLGEKFIWKQQHQAHRGHHQG